LAAIGVSTSWAKADESVTVMTKNMDAGTDFGFFFANLQTNPALGVQLTLQELQKNNFPLRAALLAQEIADSRPDVVGLQEITSLSAGPTPDTATNVFMDQLQLLIDALAAVGRPYTIVTTQTNLDVAFQVSASMAVRITDRDAIIVRADLPPGSIANIQGAHYQTILSFSGITSYRGWVSADVTVGSRSFRFVASHLESSGSLYGNPAVDLIQAAQASELAAILAISPIPVVVAADFNSNATHTPPEQTLSYGIMVSSGFTDSWRAIYRGNPGFTWPLYVEDPLKDHPQGPFERIDFVFARGLSVSFADRTGVKAPHSSDHAGVVATLGF
jgi:endonuclease/exonuclease/phosphatase family metal-dependent hydrolase